MSSSGLGREGFLIICVTIDCVVFIDQYVTVIHSTFIIFIDCTQHGWDTTKSTKNITGHAKVKRNNTKRVIEVICYQPREYKRYTGDSDDKKPKSQVHGPGSHDNSHPWDSWGFRQWTVTCFPGFCLFSNPTTSMGPRTSSVGTQGLLGTVLILARRQAPVLVEFKKGLTVSAGTSLDLVSSSASCIVPVVVVA